MWVRLIILGIAILFILILVIKRFVYFSPSYEFLAPVEDFEDIHEGNIHAWYRKGTTGKLILFCHGNSGNLSHRQDKLLKFLHMGHSVLIFDYNGFGQSKGVPSESLCYNSACMFVEFAKRRGYQQENIIPYGESLGGAVAAHVARKYNLSKVVTEGGIPSVSKVMKSRLPAFLGFLGIFFPEFNAIQYMRGYKGQYLHIHSINDEIIPHDSIKELRDLSTVSIDMEGSHNQPIIPWQAIEKFIAEN